MVNSGIVQRLCLRVGDAACSVIAFIVSYEMLPWAKAVVAQVIGSHGAVLCTILSRVGGGWDASCQRPDLVGKPSHGRHGPRAGV